MARNIVYFDLETQKSLQQVGNHRARLSELLVSVAVTFSTRTGRYEIYGESDMDQLVRELSRADLVVGHNILDFDYAVLSRYSILDLTQIPSLDTQHDLEQRTGDRIKLDALARASLGGVGKTADGLAALKWFQEGRLLDIAEYCCYDVKTTRLVHEFGAHHKRLYYFDRNGAEKRAVDVDWGL